MLNKGMYEWLRELSRRTSFVQVCALSDRPLEEAYDVELVLRFVALHNLAEDELKSIGDVGAFLTQKMMELARDKKYSYNKTEKVFMESFDTLLGSVGEDAFKRFNRQKKRHEGGFLLSQFEVVALGVGYNVRKGTLLDAGKIQDKVKSIWGAKEYTSWAASGITAARRLPRLVPFGRALFSN